MRDWVPLEWPPEIAVLNPAFVLKNLDQRDSTEHCLDIRPRAVCLATLALRGGATETYLVMKVALHCARSGARRRQAARSGGFRRRPARSALNPACSRISRSRVGITRRRYRSDCRDNLIGGYACDVGKRIPIAAICPTLRYVTLKARRFFDIAGA